MRIASSQLSLASSHQLAVKEEEHASLRVSVGGNTRTTLIDRKREGASLDAVGISAEARQARALAEQLRASAPQESEADAVPAAEVKSEELCSEESEPPRLRLFRRLIEELTKQQIRESTRVVTQEASDDAPAAQQTSGPSRAQPAASGPSWSVDFDYARSYQETEQTSVSAAGVVKTTDGKEISFALQVTMQRSYSESESVSVRAGNQKLKDPLVLHFDGPSSELSAGTFAFDIDADGEPDDIHFVSDKSAALALDHNQNGTVDDGSELFGTRTGDGFAELAAHDLDKNGWIDENDPVFDQLRLWTRSEDGQSKLRTLREGGVGAISLSAASTPFQLKNAMNQLQGVVRATSVWLTEDGSARSAQQIDLVV